MTARQALKSLCSLGVAYSQRGKGTYVSAVQTGKNIREVLSFSEKVEACGSALIRAHCPRSVLPGEEVADALSLQPADKVIRLRAFELRTPCRWGGMFHASLATCSSRAPAIGKPPPRPRPHERSGPRRFPRECVKRSTRSIFRGRSGNRRRGSMNIPPHRQGVRNSNGGVAGLPYRRLEGESIGHPSPGHRFEGNELGRGREPQASISSLNEELREYFFPV